MSRNSKRLGIAAIATSIVIIGAALWWILILREADDPLSLALEFELSCPAATDLDFSPDGRYLAISKVAYLWGGETTTVVYDLVKRRYVLGDGPGGWNCAWSSDGTELAVASNTTPEVKILDSRSWKTVRAYAIPWKSISSDALRVNRVGSLCLDRWGDVYAAIDDIVTRDEGKQNPAIVWWKDPNGPWGKYEMFAKCESSDVSCVSVSFEEDEPRVAVSYWNTPRGCDVQILRLRRNVSGIQKFELEYAIPCAAEAHVALTPDGRNLAAR